MRANRNALIYLGRGLMFGGLVLALQGLLRAVIDWDEPQRLVFHLTYFGVAALLALIGLAMHLNGRRMPDGWVDVPPQERTELEIEFTRAELRHLARLRCRQALRIAMPILLVIFLVAIAVALIVGDTELAVIFGVLFVVFASTLVVTLELIPPLSSRRPMVQRLTFSRVGYRGRAKIRRGAFDLLWTDVKRVEETEHWFVFVPRWYVSALRVMVPKRVFPTTTQQDEFRRRSERRWAPLPTSSPTWQGFDAAPHARQH